MLHGTNHPEHFEKSVKRRYRSHGCVRVEEIDSLVKYVLENISHDPYLNQKDLSIYPRKFLENKVLQSRLPDAIRIGTAIGYQVPKKKNF